MSSNIRRIVYVSQGRYAFTQDELMTMCSGFSAHNALRNVTGVLMLIGNWFLQVIEGPDEAIEELIDRIRTDERHSCVTVISDHEDEDRIFGQWSMNLLDLDSRYFVNVESVAVLREQIDDVLLNSPSKARAMKGVIRNVIAKVRSTAPLHINR